MGDYKRKFEKEYDVIIPEGYDIHHINMDHEDDNLMNLMVLPRDLHREYHQIVLEVDLASVWDWNTVIIPSNLTVEQYRRDCAMGLLVILKRCGYWADYLLYLQGKLPNIHNISFRRRSDNDVRR